MKTQVDKLQAMLRLFVVLTAVFCASAGLAAAAKCNGATCTIECTGPGPCHGTDGDDVLCGDESAQTIFALDGNDIVCAGDGDDIVYGVNGDDDLAGEGGSDTSFGQGGNDSIAGGAGDDYLQGGTGFDVILGQGGEDTCDGEVNFQCE